MNTPANELIKRQRTLARDVVCHGHGLHSGRRVRLALHPAAEDAGIVFRRGDLPAARGEVGAIWRNIVDSRFHTVLGNDQGMRVATVEHLMATLYASAIDNAVVEIDGEELPILDGSALPFVELLDEAGIETQSAPRRHMKILHPIEVRVAIRHLNPKEFFSIAVSCRLPQVGPQRWHGAVTPESFRQEIAPARAWGRLRTMR
jgi:UDP-3-O-[3-hydroxymyristoyl] N-acetylglucosamine deacetylase